MQDLISKLKCIVRTSNPDIISTKSFFYISSEVRIFIKKKVMKYFLLIFILALSACNSDKTVQVQKQSHPSHVYTYTEIDSRYLNYYESVYVPVYSDIYHRDGTKRFLLTTTVSIRNNSLLDSAYIFSATYYDSYGKELHEYIDSAILLSPLESIEFVVKEVEDVGGAGANFIIDWAAKKYSDQLLIQSVMIGSYGQQGISFLSDSKVIQREKKN